MIITDATPEDISGIQALADTVFRHLYPTLDDAARNRRLQRIYSTESLQRAITGDAAWMLVVRENDQLIGLAHFGSPLLDDCQERKEIYKFYIHPDYERQGIGGKIIKEIAKRLRQTQIVNECMVYVAGDDAPRLGFFEKNGFRHMADSDRDGEWYLVKNV